MARCGQCANPCNCTWAQDGVVEIALPAEDIFTPSELMSSTRAGRRNTVVAGRGTVAIPFTISFIDSANYRPNAFRAEATLNSTTEAFTSDPIVFNSSPDGSKSAIWFDSDQPDHIFVAEADNILVGCSVTTNTQGVAQQAELRFEWGDRADSGPIFVGGDSQNEINPELTAVGFLNQLRSVEIVGSGFEIALWIVVNFRNPTVTSTIVNVQIWGVTL